MGICSTCKRKSRLYYQIKLLQAEELGNIFSSLGKASEKVGKKILNFPGRAIEPAAYIGTAAATKNSKLNAATAPDFTKFVHQLKGLY